MSLHLTWVDDAARLDRVALARLRCYAATTTLAERFDAGVRADGRAVLGDYLLATSADADGRTTDVGTATALSMHLRVRGARLPCQGVAYVGTIKTHRRGGTADGSRGIASQLMTATLDRARERGEACSALMPFRASFYEHFGYGNAEARVEWTVPLALLPRGDFAGHRYYERADDAAVLALRAREAARGQCDVETTAAAWAHWQRDWSSTMVFVDQPAANGPVEGFAYLVEERGAQTATLVVEEWAADSPAAFRRLLHLLASLKDQYTAARITVPRDLALNRLLRESQVPHRQVDHPVATARPYTRMQLRVLDHKRFLESLTLAAPASGKLTVGVLETEQTMTRLALDLHAGRCATGSFAGDPALIVTDVVWASIVTGDLPATQAHALGLIRATDSSETRDALALLDAFAAGPAPFCQEYF